MPASLVAFMDSGRYDRHLRRMREVCRRRRDALTDAMTEHAPGLRLVGLQAGCHVIHELPVGATEDAVVAASLRRGVAVSLCRLCRGVRVCGLSSYRVNAPAVGERFVPEAPFWVSATSPRRGSGAVWPCSGGFSPRRQGAD